VIAAEKACLKRGRFLFPKSFLRAVSDAVVTATKLERNNYMKTTKQWSAYKKKPVVVSAIQWNGKNWREIEAGLRPSDNVTFCGMFPPNCTIEIKTLEGVMTASVGDFLIRGVKGELYPRKPDIFEATYECEKAAAVDQAE
jgi:hypothetical protein